MMTSSENGSGNKALEWVEQSALDETEKLLLGQFIKRFADQTFFRDERAALSRIERQNGIALPEWFVYQRNVLAFAAHAGLVCIDDFDHIGPRSDTIDRIRYDFALRDYRDDEQRDLFCTAARVFPIACWPMTDRSFLAINLDDHTDRRIYEFGAFDLSDNLSEGVAVRNSVYPAFDSYASLLSHIIAFESA